MAQNETANIADCGCWAPDNCTTAGKCAASGLPLSKTMSSHDQSAKPAFAPGQRWKPRYGAAASMTRIITQITLAGVVYGEAWPSEIHGSFDRWSTWADWLTKTGAELQEETNDGQ